ncbi:TIGR02302 family protein [Sinorhizobium alkalisoli]|uniref:TIGR02302 family protein n=1 Tax=Sinorhizobium alkalisoli TaxID=1752398 RepID=A0A1E3VAQ3_9HYPH|nr:TIGR02302 family protein [Sinorhizobium alkalisoli]ODR90683.1 TIGR02302 family protein [Sinorhizobium alkalisoli]QFI67482.1 Methyl-accepting chemotaxis protein [Sinorhizobium alkalisoli]
MTQFRQDDTPRPRSFVKMLAAKRLLAQLVLVIEAVLPRTLGPLSFVLLFLSAAWLGFFRVAPLWLHVLVLLGFVAGLFLTLLPLTRIRWPEITDADRMLEERNRLPHQAIRVQDDIPATHGLIGAALWREHQARMAQLVRGLGTGMPRPDVARHDPFAVRAVPILIACIAFAYSYSNRAGLISDAFHLPEQQSIAPDIRIDAWVTPPAYTGRAPLFLTGRQDMAATDEENAPITIPQFSDLTVRITGTAEETEVSYSEAHKSESTIIPASDGKPDSQPNAQSADGSPKGARNFLYKITRDGTLSVADKSWNFRITPDSVPDIAFADPPRPMANGSLEISFLAHDDYGISQAWAEIKPLEEPAKNARPLYPLPEYRLDLPRRNAREAKGTTNRNLSEHPLSGKRVEITLVARDAAGQEGRSVPEEMVLPARRFFDPLAASVAEQRQIFALDANRLPRSIELNEALMLYPEVTIPNLTHFLLLQSARTRMQLARNDDMLRDAADHLWEIALGIEDGDLSLAERRLRDAQQALSDALDRNAPDEEIAKLMEELREAMQDYMQALAEQLAKNPPVAGNFDMNNVMRQQDLERLMDQIENLARSGARDEARQLLSELQRMMSNLPSGRMMQQMGENNAMRQQMDKLGQLMQQQQQLMDETFKLDQALRDRMQRGDPLQGEDNELFGQDMPQDPGQGSDPNDQTNPLDGMTADELREALKQLKQQQEGLGKQLGELQKGLEDLGIKPGKGFGEAQKEMGDAAGALGEGQGERAVGSQGRALQALREGAQDMMSQMQAQGQQQGPGMGMPQYGQSGRDPLGRRHQNAGPYFDDRVQVPDEIDTQRARQILDAIRRKLGDNLSPELERQYLERLLDLR